MNESCENCGWSEIVGSSRWSEIFGSPIMCYYNGHKTWHDGCCEAWKPKEKESNMVEVVRCKDCVYYIAGNGCGNVNGESPARNLFHVRPDWFCADGERGTDDA